MSEAKTNSYKNSLNNAIIINADDFGISLGVSEGIVRAANEGVLTSTTVQANLPQAEESIKLLKDAPQLGVGIHLTISAGKPLTNHGLLLANRQGRLKLSAQGTFFKLLKKPSLLNAVEIEFEAQIKWMLDHGIEPDHIDSHKHSHAYPPLYARVVKLAKKYNIPFIRQYGEKMPSRQFPPHNPANRKAHRLLNMLGKINGARFPKVRGTIGTWGILHTGLISSDWLIAAANAAIKNNKGVVEFMTHPGDIHDLTPDITRMKNSRQRELKALTDPLVKKAYDSLGVNLINYRQLSNFK